MNFLTLALHDRQAGDETPISLVTGPIVTPEGEDLTGGASHVDE
jgi:hypothetical protein